MATRVLTATGEPCNARANDVERSPSSNDMFCKQARVLKYKS